MAKAALDAHVEADEPDPAAARDAAVACDVCFDERWVNREVGYDGVEWGNPCPDCIPESEPVRACGPYCGCNPGEALL